MKGYQNLYNGTKINKNTSLIDTIFKAAILAHYRIQNKILAAFKIVLFGSNKHFEAERILIFRTGSLGDSVCALPAIYSIRKNFPDAEIDILSNAGAENLVSLGALIDRSIVNKIINYFGTPKKDLFKKLREKKYELFIQLPQYDAGFTRLIRDMFIAKALKVKYAFGWQVDSTWFLANYQAKFVKFENERDRLLGILEKNGLKCFGFVYPLGFTQEIKSKIENVILSRVENGSLKDKQNNVGMVVGAKRPQNRWPIEHFKEVADYLLKQNKSIFLFGGPEDFELAEHIKGENVINFCDKLTPLETAEMIKHCKLIISNDTGPMHLAYAVDTPLIAIFSSRDYARKWYPPAVNVTLRSNINLCSACFEKCKRNNECMKNINPLTVIDSLKKFLVL